MVLGGEPFDPARSKGKGLPGDVVLELPDLPTQTEWRAALELAGHAFGVTVQRKALTGENLRGFARTIDDKIKEQAAAAQRLPHALEAWRAALGFTTESVRLVTATGASELIAATQSQPPAGLVRTMAAFAGTIAGTSPQAIGRSLATAAVNVQALDDGLVLGVFRQLHGKRRELTRAAPILAEVEATLRQDELQRALARMLRQAAREAQDVLQPEDGPGDGGCGGDKPDDGDDQTRVLISTSWQVVGRARVLEAIAEVEATLKALRDAAEADPDDELELAVQIDLVGRGAR